jgi:hypothetical protein
VLEAGWIGMVRHGLMLPFTAWPSDEPNDQVGVAVNNSGFENRA